MGRFCIIGGGGKLKTCPTFAKEEKKMDPVAQLFGALILVLVVAAVVIPQIQQRMNRNK
jgi:hypothetical protein